MSALLVPRGMLLGMTQVTVIKRGDLLVVDNPG